MTKWFIFKCQNCGKKFKEKFSKEHEKSIEIDHLGRYGHIVSTHSCKDGTYGCGMLIGAEIRSRVNNAL